MVIDPLLLDAMCFSFTVKFFEFLAIFELDDMGVLMDI